jgi:hypothetical protein
MKISFKTYIKRNLKRNSIAEALHPDMRAAVRTWPEGPDFTGSPHRSVTVPVTKTNQHIEAPDDVKDHLEKHGYTVSDYANNKATRQVTVNHPVHGTIQKNVTENIGAALRKTNANSDIIASHENDPNRNHNNADELLMTVRSGHGRDASEHGPTHDGMTDGSTGQGWTSCTNLGDGVDHEGKPVREKDEAGPYYETVEPMCAAGTHIAYLHHKSDPQCKRPIARMSMQPYKSETGEIGLKPSDVTYGQHSQDFTNAVHAWTEKNAPINHKYDQELADGVYGDGLPERISGHHIENESEFNDAHIRNKRKYLNTEKLSNTIFQDSIKDADLSRALATNKNLTKDQVDSVVKDSKLHYLIQHRTDLSKDHIKDIMLRSPENTVSAMNNNPNSVDSKMLDTLARHPSDLDREFIASHPKTSQDTLNHLIDNFPYTHRSVILDRKKLKPEQISNLIAGNGENLNYLIDKHEINSDHAKQILANSDALRHISDINLEKLITKHKDSLSYDDMMKSVSLGSRTYEKIVKNLPNQEHITRAMKDPDLTNPDAYSEFNRSLAANKNLSDEHVAELIYDRRARSNLLRNPALRGKNIDKLLEDEDNHNSVASYSTNLEPHHIDKILNSKSRHGITGEEIPNYTGMDELLNNKHVKFSPHHIDKMIEDGDYNTHENIIDAHAKNKDNVPLQKHHIDKFIESSGHHVQNKIAETSNLSDEQIHKLIDSAGDDRTMGRLLRRKDLPITDDHIGKIMNRFGRTKSIVNALDAREADEAEDDR